MLGGAVLPHMRMRFEGGVILGVVHALHLVLAHRSPPTSNIDGNAVSDFRPFSKGVRRK